MNSDISNKSVLFVYNTARYLANLRGELIKSLLSMGVRVDAVVPEDESSSELRNLGVTVYPWNLSSHGVNPLKELASYVALKRMIKKCDADVVFNFTVKPVIYGSAAAASMGTRHIFSMITGRGYLFGDGGVRSSVLKILAMPLYRRSLKYNEKVFFQNFDDMCCFLDNRLVTPNQAVRVNGSGVDIDKFKPSSNSAIPGTFLLIARLLKEKGIHEYAGAARILKNKYPHARFMLLGPLSTAPTGVRGEQVRAWHEEGIIEYLGETADVIPYLASTMVFVLPSYYREGVPRTALEALAMGKPVITTDWPGCREVVNSSENGILVPVRDTEALANAMERFLIDPGLYDDMGAKSRRLAESRFDVRRVNSVIMKHILQ